MSCPFIGIHLSYGQERFVYELDKIMPPMQVCINGGKSWHGEGITLEKLHAVKAPKVRVSPEIDYYYQQPYKLIQR